MFSFVDIRVALLLSAAVLLARGLSEEDVPSRGCTYNGKVYGDQDRWKPDPCQFCFCNSGDVLCSMPRCMYPSGCTNPIVPEGQCCPICPDDGIKRGGGSRTGILW
ncbi:collagen alpha-1(I) chain [Pleuronectes platessa]|uniref:collagen alpha-1(I) chain n=1 Tax=Pleuronectes platessa TaxID=8262 RepID=UPI00232A17A7|nr:collagen alpha-1(I) chain [Pleuronectes platessa]